MSFNVNYCLFISVENSLDIFTYLYTNICICKCFAFFLNLFSTSKSSLNEKSIWGALNWGSYKWGCCLLLSFWLLCDRNGHSAAAGICVENLISQTWIPMQKCFVISARLTLLWLGSGFICLVFVLFHFWPWFIRAHFRILGAFFLALLFGCGSLSFICSLVSLFKAQWLNESCVENIIHCICRSREWSSCKDIKLLPS